MGVSYWTHDAVRRGCAAAQDRSVFAGLSRHSTHRVTSSYDVRPFAEFIAAFGKQFDRVQICLYWKDILNGVASLYERYGFELVTAGHMYDDGFLPRLGALIGGADYVLTNEIGTHVFYSVLADKPVWVRRQRIERFAANEQIMREDVDSFEADPTYLKLLSLFSEARGDLSAEQKEFVAELTGEAYHRSPEQMRQILEEAEREFLPFFIRSRYRSWIMPRYWGNKVKQRLLPHS